MNIFERRKLTLFITCLSVAILAWLFFAFSNRYIYQASSLIRYTNAPPEKAFHSLQSDTVELQIEGTGWSLLFSRFRLSPNQVNVDLRSLNDRNYLSLSDQLDQINRQFSSEQRIIAIQPDTLFFDFSKTNVKKVPVKLSYQFRFKPRHYLSSLPEIEPAYVTVMGPAEELAKIDFWDTDSLKKTDLSKSFSSRVYLKRSQKSNVSILPTFVQANIAIDEFTEKRIDLPIKVLNNESYDVKLLPEKVRLTYLTALSNYGKIDRDAIQVTVDLGNWENKGYQQLPVKIEGFPDFYKLISIEPQIVDFIIQ